MTWIAWGGLPNRESKAWLLRADQRKTSRTVALAGSNPNVMRLSLNSKFAESVFSNFAVSTAAGASALASRIRERTAGSSVKSGCAGQLLQRPRCRRRSRLVARGSEVIVVAFGYAIWELNLMP